MKNNLIPFAKLQISALSPVLALCIVLLPMSSLKVTDYRGTVIFGSILTISALFIMNSFGVTDEKYKVKYLFHTLPVSPSVVVGVRWMITYGLVILVLPVAVLLSHATAVVRPEVLQPLHFSPLCNGFLLAAMIIPLCLLIYFRFSAERATIIASILLMVLVTSFSLGQGFFSKFLSGRAWAGNLILAVCINYLCLKICITQYKRRIR